MCPASKMDSGKILKKIMSLHHYQKIAADIFPRTRSLHLSCGYEPLLVDHFDRCLIISKEYRIPFVSFATNGMLTDEHICRVMIRSQIDEIIVSADGATPSTFESIREGASFSRLIQNLKRLQEMKKNANSKKPILRINYTFMDRNIFEVPEFIERFANFGMEILQLRLVMINDAIFNRCDFLTEQGVNNYNRIISRVQEICKKKNILLIALPAIRSVERIINDDDNESSGKRKKTNACILPWITFVINSSGDLMACLSGQKMGNILEKSYDEIVRFDNMQEFIRTVKASNFFCNHCPLKEELIA
jgi:MoaA/NifB/PqqE/SkfB family radical SAM enzyme